MRMRLILSAMLLFSLFSIPARSQAVYSITDLGSLSPTGINTWAQIVGNTNNQAYLWTFGHVRALGTLQGGTFSYAAAINDLGVIVGTADGSGTVLPGRLYSGAGSQQCTSLIQPFTWNTWNKQMQGLGTVGATDVREAWCVSPFYAASINDKGNIAGYTGQLQDDFQWGFGWTSADGFSLYGSSFPPAFSLGISNTGQIVGETQNVGDSGVATYWKNGTETYLGGLPNSQGSEAAGVNDLGQMVGWSFDGNYMHAVIWSQSGKITDLGTLPGDSDSSARKINLFGLVIGSSGNTFVVSTISEDYRHDGPLEVVGRPFVWSTASGMQDLNTLIPSKSGWILNSATDINLWGQIVGEGTLNGQPHGFLLTPKNPFKLLHRPKNARVELPLSTPSQVPNEVARN